MVKNLLKRNQEVKYNFLKVIATKKYLTPQLKEKNQIKMRLTSKNDYNTVNDLRMILIIWNLIGFRGLFSEKLKS